MSDPELIDTIARRFVLELLQESSAQWWEKRSAQFRQVGNARCDEIALACLNRAKFERWYGLDDTEADAEMLDLVLAELKLTRRDHGRAA